MDSETPTFVSVIITAFNEGHHMDRILQDVSRQNYPTEFLEVLVIEAGDYPEERTKAKLGEKSEQLRYWRIPTLSRTAALNLLVKESKGDLIVRLDARTHIQADYLERIVNLSRMENAANVGGVLVPVGESVKQVRIAKIMRHPLCFGGGKFRDINYTGLADTVYLGAFSRKKMFQEPWFDELHPKIGEDSDLNFRIRKIGGKVVVNSSIKVLYYSRESLKDFVKLCFNYGVGRGLNILKHKQVAAGRQFILPSLFLLSLILFAFGFINPISHLILLTGVFLYLGLLGIISTRLADSDGKEIFFLMACFFGCHLFWMLGLFKSIQVFNLDLKLNS
jgi:succinoglycan biosynthesis protein ExoA